jgi:transposase
LDRGAEGADRRREESGETVCAVVRRHGLTPQRLFGWRRGTAGGRRGRQGRHCICASATVIVEAARSYDRRCDGSDCARDQCRHVADGAARGDGGVIVTVPVGMPVLVVTKPVDFRTGAKGLRRWCTRRSARIRSRGRSSKRADSVKILAWDGLAWFCSGNGWSTGHFGGCPIGDGIMRLSASQLGLVAAPCTRCCTAGRNVMSAATF